MCELMNWGELELHVELNGEQFRDRLSTKTFMLFQQPDTWWWFCRSQSQCQCVDSIHKSQETVSLQWDLPRYDPETRFTLPSVMDNQGLLEWNFGFGTDFEANLFEAN